MVDFSRVVFKNELLYNLVQQRKEQIVGKMKDLAMDGVYLTKYDDTIELHGLGTLEGFVFGGSINNIEVDSCFGSVTFNVTDPDKQHTLNVVLDPEQFDKFAKIVGEINAKLQNP